MVPQGRMRHDRSIVTALFHKNDDDDDDAVFEKKMNARDHAILFARKKIRPYSFDLRCKEKGGSWLPYKKEEARVVQGTTEWTDATATTI